MTYLVEQLYFISDILNVIYKSFGTKRDLFDGLPNDMINNNQNIFGFSSITIFIIYRSCRSTELYINITEYQ